MSFSFDYTYDYYPLFTFQPITSSDSISGNLSVKVYPVWYKQITLEWSIPSDWGSAVFNVYKSPTGGGNYEKITPQPVHGTYLKDTTTTQYSKFIEDFYIVEALLTSGKRIQSNPVTWNNSRTAWVELRALEVQRREWLLLRKFVGINSYVLRRKTYGQRCSVCWNFQLEKIMQDKCPSCMGTSFEGGYYDAVNTLLQYDASPNDISLTYFGKFETNQLSAWTIAYPELRSRDIIYRVPDGNIYIIDDWFNTELQTVTVRQILKLVQLDKESPEYRLIITNNLIPSQYQT